jgi:hypothetical protein
MESTMVGIKAMKLSNFFHHSMELMPGVKKFGLRLYLLIHKHMSNEELSLRRLKCTEVKTGQRR